LRYNRTDTTHEIRLRLISRERANIKLQFILLFISSLSFGPVNDSILTRLQAISNNGIDFYKNGGAEITSQKVDVSFTLKNISKKVLLYTDHYRKYFGTENWSNSLGVTTATACWLGEKEISAFGLETMSPGVPNVSNKEVHQICGELGFTHYENMVNLHKLIDRGHFRFIALPLKIRGGTGSPVRAVAVFEHNG
jgi:kynurenine formamidase